MVNLITIEHGLNILVYNYVMSGIGSERVNVILKRDRAMRNLRVVIAEHFAANAEQLNYARSSECDDLENLRTALDPGFTDLSEQIRRLGMSQKTVARVIRNTVFQGNVDPNYVNAIADECAKAYVGKLRDYKTSLQAPRLTRR